MDKGFFVNTIKSLLIAVVTTMFAPMVAFASETVDINLFVHDPATKSVLSSYTIISETNGVMNSVMHGSLPVMGPQPTATNVPQKIEGVTNGTKLMFDTIPGVTYTLVKVSNGWELRPDDGSETIHQDFYYDTSAPAFHVPYMAEEVSMTVYYEKNLPQKFKNRGFEFLVCNKSDVNTAINQGTQGVIGKFKFGESAASFAQGTEIVLTDSSRVDKVGRETVVYSKADGREVAEWKLIREFSDFKTQVIINGSSSQDTHFVYQPSFSKDTEACVYYALPEYYVKVKWSNDTGKENLRPSTVKTKMYVQTYVNDLTRWNVTTNSQETYSGNAYREYDYSSRKLAKDSGGNGDLTLSGPSYQSAMMVFNRDRTNLNATKAVDVDYNWAAYARVLGGVAERSGNYTTPDSQTRASYGNVIEIPMILYDPAQRYELYTIWKGDEGRENLRPSYYTVDIVKAEGATRAAPVQKTSTKNGKEYYRDLGTTAGNGVDVKMSNKIQWYSTEITYEGNIVYVTHTYNPIKYHTVVEFVNDAGHENERPTVTFNTTNYLDPEAAERNIKLTKDVDWKYSWVTSESVEEGWNINVNDLNSRNWIIQRIVHPSTNGDRTFHIIIRYRDVNSVDGSSSSESSNGNQNSSTGGSATQNGGSSNSGASNSSSTQSSASASNSSSGAASGGASSTSASTGSKKETTLIDDNGNKVILEGDTKKTEEDGKTYVTDSTGKKVEIDPDTLKVKTNDVTTKKPTGNEETILVDKDGNKTTLVGETKTSTKDGKTYVTDSKGKTVEINPNTLEVIKEVKPEAPTPEVKKKSLLPQTGRDWVTVIIVAFCGIAVIVAAIIVKKNER